METKAEVWIPLTQGKVAVIDFEDFEKVRGIKWYAYQDSRRKDGAWYARRNVGRPCQKTLSLHRFLTDAPPDKQVLHVDGNGLNCRRANMRLGTVLENARGKRLRCAAFASTFRGVSWCNTYKKWKARIKVNGTRQSGTRYSLGYFNIETDAAKAYDSAALKYFGEFAALNFPIQKENECSQSNGGSV